jgi:hypothetical protein
MNILPREMDEYEEIHTNKITGGRNAITLTVSSPEKSFSSVRNNIQWHSCLSLIGTQGLLIIVEDVVRGRGGGEDG